MFDEISYLLYIFKEVISMNKCIVCNQETKNKKYCSVNCKYIAMSKPKSNCLNCGKTLDRCDVKYCSKKCYNEYKHKEFVKTIQYNKCIICGKDTRNEKYCSMKCSGQDTTRCETAIKNLKNEHSWTEEELLYLKENYGSEPISDIAKKFNTTKQAVITYASKNKIKSQRKWTKRNEEYLLEHKNDNINDLSIALNKTKQSIIAKFRTLNGFANTDGTTIISPQDYILQFIENELKLECLNEIPIGNFVTDILINKLDIEIQGTYWHGDSRILDDFNDKYIKIQDRDNRKKEYFNSLGIEIYYIWEYDIYSNPEKCKQDLINKLKELKII